MEKIEKPQKFSRIKKFVDENAIWLNKIASKDKGESEQDDFKPRHPLFSELNAIIESNMDSIREYGLHEDSPPFLLNHVAEQIKNEEKVKNEEIPPSTNEKKEPTSASASTKRDDSQQESPAPQPEADKKDVVKPILTRQNVKGLADALKSNVFGQDAVIDDVVSFLNNAAVKLKINKKKPAGCYLFAGPSGVGKTELAQTLAEKIGVPLLKINMGEYGLEPDVTKLIGTSAGYVGYENGGLLTNFVKKNGACVVLLDELEKAHPSIDNILLSIMDHGTCTDNRGNVVPFTETIVISTSNLGAEVEYIEGLDKEAKNALREESIKQGIRPEIINRYDDRFHFEALGMDDYKKIINKFIAILDSNMVEEHGVKLKFTPKIIDFIAEKSYDPAFGGRPARRFIEKIVIKPLVDKLLDDDFDKQIKESKELTFDLNKKGDICFKSKGKIIAVVDDTKELVARVENSKFSKQKIKP